MGKLVSAQSGGGEGGSFSTSEIDALSMVMPMFFKQFPHEMAALRPVRSMVRSFARSVAVARGGREKRILQVVDKGNCN